MSKPFCLPALFFGLRSSVFRLLPLGLFFSLILCTPALAQLKWPAVNTVTKPWTRWWWMGNTVNKRDLTAAMEKYQKAGLGGLEITSIYGVQGYEDQFINYLSPQWMDMLTHTLQEGKRLNMGIDMATGTGWPFGGPWVSAEDACKYSTYKTYSLKEGESLKENISYQQEPLLRFAAGRKAELSQLTEPISSNKNLQGLALDQVRFEKPLPLQTLMAYSNKGETINLTSKVDATGKLNWVAPAGDWSLYALFQGWHGKMVERAGPGGEGNVIDHFSDVAVKNYLQQFDKAFAGKDISSLRAFFNDSYEVDDAQGQANWTPNLFEEFKKRQGYDLRDHLPALFGKDTEEKNARVLCDYRELISELLLEKFTTKWSDWAKSKGAIIRNQAHGSPANILDLYEVVDIPEMEGAEVLRIKFASSASHVSGKKLTSSESATWLNEHFSSNLGDIKKSVDRYLVSGVNHIFYHGTCYSPQNEVWPGWLFYAAVHLTPANSLWNDFSALNNYVTRCQSFLQTGKSDNDVLLYFPIYDSYSEGGRAILKHFDGMDGFKGTSFQKNADSLLETGYSFDFISDKQIQKITVAQQKLQTGGVSYQTIVLSEPKYIPLETLEKIVSLVKNGATVIFYKSLPQDVPGYRNLTERQKRFKDLLSQINFSKENQSAVKEAKLGQGTVLVGEDLNRMLSYAKIRRESIADEGLQFIRRQSDSNGNYYFIVNWGNNKIDKWVPLQIAAKSAAIFNPVTEKTGLAKMRKSANGNIEVYLQLEPGESCIVQSYNDLAIAKVPLYDYYKSAGTPQELKGTWTINFVEGGPELPAEVKTDQLGSWTKLNGDAVKKFSGTAKYTISFPKPAGTSSVWRLNLGRVCESAQVTLNGKDLGTLIGPNHEIQLDGKALATNNVLEIKVSNLMANRIIDLEKRGIQWKKFYNVNFPARKSENRNEKGLFDASKWEPRDSGLIGPVTLTPLEVMSF